MMMAYEALMAESMISFERGAPSMMMKSFLIFLRSLSIVGRSILTTGNVCSFLVAALSLVLPCGSESTRRISLP